MVYDPQIHHRRSIRLRGYDYARPGMYSVTVCTHGKEHLFGETVEREMKHSQYAEFAALSWNDLPRHYTYVRLDSFAVMPNHVHGIIEITGDVRAGPRPAPTPDRTRRQERRGLAEIVCAFKSFSARRINEIRGTGGQPIWQRNYYEHIIRNQRELEITREYIATNPMRWDADPENVMPLWGRV